MATEKHFLTENEWSLFRVVNSESTYSEFVRYYDVENGEPFRLWPKQIRELNRESLHKRRIQGRYLGKALALDTPIPTPSGWSTMGEIKVGDLVLSEDGQPVEVIAESPIYNDHDCYRITFSDGASVIADAGHRWRVDVISSHGKSFVLTTEQMASMVMKPSARRKERNLRLPLSSPLDLPTADLPIPPYTLGAWLGDGHSAGSQFTCADPQIVEEIRNDGYDVRSENRKYVWGIGRNREGIPFRTQLRNNALLNNKHIPDNYLRSSINQRLSLLQGLMDTDGYAGSNGMCEITSTKEKLAYAIIELINTLGIKPSVYVGLAKLYGENIGPKWRISFSQPVNFVPFRLNRKANRIILHPDDNSTCSCVPKKNRRSESRYIDSIIKVNPTPVKCISVDSPTHLFLITRDMIPTHNSITCMDEFTRRTILYSGQDGVALFGTRSEPNMQPIFDKMVSQFERNHLLRFFLISGVRSVDRKSHEIRLRNNAIIKGRIQGKDGQGFNTIHPSICAWLDEAQLLSDNAIAEFYGMVSAELPLLASGVPNGVRTSWAYHIDTDLDSDFVGGSMTRLDDPRMTPEFLETLKRAYGGENSNLYRQKVLGEWGADARMTFDLDRIEHDMPSKNGERSKAPPYYRTVVLDTRNYAPERLPELFTLRKDMPPASRIWIAADHGQTASPTTGYVHFYDDKENCWRQYMRFLLYGMHVHPQSEIFNYLASELGRMYDTPVLIGLDTTGQGGQAVASVLEELGHKVTWANVAEKVVFGERLETDEEMLDRYKKDPFSGTERKLVQMEMPLRQVAIPQSLIPAMYSGSLRVVEDKDIWEQLAGTVDYEDAIGRYRKYETDYSKDGNPNYNHDLSAFEVFGAMLHREEFAPGEPRGSDLWTMEMDLGWGLINEAI